MTMWLDEKIIAIERALVAAEIPHAFGGANALAYYGTPRATHDIDLNVFVRASRAEDVLKVLGELEISVGEPRVREAIARDGQVRVYWERTPVDLFFSYDALHDSSMERRRRVDFGGEAIHVMSGEDLIVYKVIFDREKDWRDVAEMIYATDRHLEFDYVRTWLARILEADDARHERLERLIASGGDDLRY